MWAIPGGFKRPTETLDEAAKRELAEETGVDAASLLTQFGAYGDPERDPRMNVVTIAYLAVLRESVRSWPAPTRPTAALVPVTTALDGTFELAFDHARIVHDAADRVRIDLESERDRDGIPRTDVHARRAPNGVRGRLGRAPRRRQLPAEPPRGGRLGDPHRAQSQARHDRRQAGGALSRWTDVETRRADSVPAPRRQTKGNEMKAVVFDRYGPPEVLRVEEVERPAPKEDEVLVRFMPRRSTGRIAGFAVPSRSSPVLHRPASTEVPDSRHGVRRRGRSSRRRPSASFRSATRCSV